MSAMTWAIEHIEGDGVALRWSGPFEFEEYLVAIEDMDRAVAELGPDGHAVVDARAMTAPPLEPADLHRLSSELFRRVGQGSSFRVALVATGGAADLFESLLQMRDMVSLSQAHDRPTARVFGDYDVGLAWARND